MPRVSGCVPTHLKVSTPCGDDKAPRGLGGPRKETDCRPQVFSEHRGLGEPRAWTEGPAWVVVAWSPARGGSEPAVTSDDLRMALQLTAHGGTLGVHTMRWHPQGHSEDWPESKTFRRWRSGEQLGSGRVLQRDSGSDEGL